MKIIYLEVSDDRLEALSHLFNERFQSNFVICRGDGYAYNEHRMKELKKELKKDCDLCTILTNDNQFIDSHYCWEGETSVDSEGFHNLWFACGDKLILAQDTTDRKLRFAHNLARLYDCRDIGFKGARDGITL